MMLAPLFALHLASGATLAPVRELAAVTRAVTDAGHEEDAGHEADAGHELDAGHDLDAGHEVDAGTDAGYQEITDAGPPPKPIDAGPIGDAGQTSNTADMDQGDDDSNAVPTSCDTGDDCPNNWQCVSNRCEPDGTVSSKDAASFGCSSASGSFLVAALVIGAALARRRRRQ